MVKEQPPAGRIYVTIAVGLVWLFFLAVWLFFYAGLFSLIQNIAVFLASLVIVAAVTVALWLPWSMKHGE